MSKVKDNLLRIENLIENLESLHSREVESITLKVKSGRHIIIENTDYNALMSICSAVSSIKNTLEKSLQQVSQYIETL